MNLSIWAACVASQVCLVAGQILVKHAMQNTLQRPWSMYRIIPAFVAGIGSLTLWFLLWGNLLQKKDLSYIYPFEGISPVLIVIAARVFLGERIAPRSWLGVALIGCGVAVVASS